MNQLVVRKPYAVARPAPDDVDRRPLGTAAWLSNPGEALKAFREGDIWLGRTAHGTAMGINDDRHIGVASTTRGGKGVSVIIPNLLMWKGSVVVIDPKGENAIVTARRRGHGSDYSKGMGQRVRILDPFDAVMGPGDTYWDLKCSFNPMAGISADKEASIDIAARIADSLVISDGVDSFFDDAAKGLLKSLILHVATSNDYSPSERTLPTVRRLVMAGDYKARALYQALAKPDEKVPSGYECLAHNMMRNRAFGGVVSDAGARLKDLLSSPRTLASIVQMAATNTDFMDSPGMKRCLAQSSFTLDELKSDPKGVSLFVTLPQEYMDTHFRWLRMMTALIIGEMQRVKSKPASGHRVLMVLDEFAALKRMKVIENAAAQIAGFGVKLMFVVQTLGQLKDIYKDNWETLFANCGIKQFFYNDDHFTRKHASDLIGECEVVRPVSTTSSAYSRSLSQSKSTTNGRNFGNSFGYSNGASYSAQGASSNSGMNAGMSEGFSYANGSGETDGETNSRTYGVSDSIQKRALVTPDEIGRMFTHTPLALTLVSGFQPFAMQRTPYYADPSFAGLFDPHPWHALPLTHTQRIAKFFIDKEAQEIREANDRRKRNEEQLELGVAALVLKEQQDKQAAIERKAKEQLQANRNAEKRREARRHRIRSLIVDTAFWTLMSVTGLFVVFALYLKMMKWFY